MKFRSARPLLPLSVIVFICTIELLTIAIAPILAQEARIEFSPERWDLTEARIVDHLGRQALSGTAFLKDVTFEDGIIAVDFAVTGARSYPGIIFRMEKPGEYERVYIRPHRSGCMPPPLYSDVLQYVPAFNGIDSWQLHNGEGATAAAVIPTNQWFRVRLEVLGDQARVFIGDSEQPALLIHELSHGKSRGTIGLTGPMDGSAFFSNFTIRADTSLRFDPPPRRETPPGLLFDWQISRPFPALRIDLEKTPAEQGLTDLSWKNVTAAASGLVDVSHYYPRSGEPDCIFARTVIKAEKNRTLKLNFGYSDFISIFLNGRLLFTANSAYQSRDPSFLGIAGFFDTVYLPLEKGENKLLLAVAESFGGWGFMAQDGDAIYQTQEIKTAWETPREFLIPESAAYDPISGAVFVSNFDGYNRSVAEAKQFISRATVDGEIENLRWVGGMKNPTGLVVRGNTLYAVESTALVEIDIAAAKIIERHEVPGAAGLNDIAVDAAGTIYISDFRKGVIFKFADGQFEEWLKGSEVSRPNGVWVEGERLIWGNNGDGGVKSADLATKAVTVLTRLGQGIIDGVVGDGQGNVLVSHNEGRLYRIMRDGEVVKLLDTTAIGSAIADFTFIPEKRLLIAPTFTDCRVKAWRLEL